jgi:tetratricopeptide (TPR) repeat protein
MRERLAEMNAELEAEWGIELTTRTGINTGVVSGIGVARAQNFVAGDAANTAARLQQNARAGEVLLGQSTYKLVRDGVLVDVLEPIPMKGKAEPVPVFALTGVRDDAEALTRRHGAPLVGRDHELALLAESYEASRTGLSPALALLLADAGMGKSRLVGELVRTLEDEALVLVGRCLSYGEGITFWPLVEVIRQAAGLEGDEPAESERAKLTIVTEGDEEVVERIASLLGLTEAQFPVQELFWAARRLLETLAERRPLIVVFDDIHWAAPTFLDLIEFLIDSSFDVPLVLLCASRPDLLEQRPHWRDHERAVVVPLRPLSQEEAGRVIDNMLGGVGIPDDVRGRIAAGAAGNPLFVEQMLSMLIDEGFLRRRNGRFEAAADLSELAVPPSIQALLAARVDRLAKDDRAVVEPAAVVGVSFPQPAVEQLVPESLAPRVGERLAGLTERQLVHPDEEAAAEDVAIYRFSHVLVRDAAYEAVLKETRAALHEQVATWAERFYGERGRELEFEEILGYHLEQAYAYRVQLGPIDDHARELAARGADRLAAAGRRAFGRSDMLAAANLLERATQLRPPGDPERLVLLPDLAESLTVIGRFPSALEALDEALTGAAELGDDRLRAEASLGKLFAEGAAGGGWSERIIPDVERAMAQLERHSDHRGLAKGWRLLGSIHGTAGRFAAAADAVQQAIVHARLADDQREELRNTAAYAQALLLGPTPVLEAIAECERILERAGSDRRTRAHVLRMLAPLYAMRGGFDEARAAYVSARALLEDLGLTVLASSVSLESAPAEVLAGRLDAAERELRRDYETLERIGEQYFRSTIAGLLADVLYAEGREPEALELTEVAREISDDDDTTSQALWRSVRAKLLAHDGNADDAVRLAREAVEFTRRSDSPVMQAGALVDLAEVLSATDRPYGETLDEAVALYEREGNVVAAEAASSRLTTGRSPA